MSDIGETLADTAIANATDEYEKTGRDEISNYAENLINAANYYRNRASYHDERIAELEAGIESAMRICDLWMPIEYDRDKARECEALGKMHSKFK